MKYIYNGDAPLTILGYNTDYIIAINDEVSLLRYVFGTESFTSTPGMFARILLISDKIVLLDYNFFINNFILSDKWSLNE